MLLTYKFINMKRFQTIIKFIVCSIIFLAGRQEVNAQYYLTDDGVHTPYLYIQGTRVYDEHRQITDDELEYLFSNVEGINYSERFMRARTSFGVGIGFTVTGVALAAGGVLSAGLTDTRIPAYITLGGVALTLIGIPTFCVSRGKMHTYLRRYNRMNWSNLYAVTAGPQQHGIGLALKF